MVPAVRVLAAPVPATTLPATRVLATTVPAATGPFATGPSATGPSATGPFATGPSGQPTPDGLECGDGDSSNCPIFQSTFPGVAVCGFRQHRHDELRRRPGGLDAPGGRAETRLAERQAIPVRIRAVATRAGGYQRQPGGVHRHRVARYHRGRCVLFWPRHTAGGVRTAGRGPVSSQPRL